RTLNLKAPSVGCLHGLRVGSVGRGFERQRSSVQVRVDRAVVDHHDLAVADVACARDGFLVGEYAAIAVDEVRPAIPHDYGSGALQSDIAVRAQQRVVTGAGQG